MANKILKAKEMYPSPAALAKRVDEYNNLCGKSNVFPDEHNMRLYLQLTKAQVDELCADKDSGEAYRLVMEKEKDVRAGWLCRKMSADSKSASGCMNLLKQAENGGYTDRPVENQDRVLKIELSGVGGEKSFK